MVTAPVVKSVVHIAVAAPPKHEITTQRRSYD